jgi:Tol biopolymer transport system component
MRRIEINVHPLRDFLVLLLVAVLTVILLALVTPKPAEATFPGTNGSIVFESDLTGDTDLYSMAPNGTGLTRLTNSTWQEHDPVFSPAGTQIAYTDEREPDDEIFVMNAYGTQTNLTNNQVDDYHPTWSPPGGKAIAFVSERDLPFHGDIYTMNVDTKQTKRLPANDPQNPDDFVYDPQLVV